MWIWRKGGIYLPSERENMECLEWGKVGGIPIERLWFHGLDGCDMFGCMATCTVLIWCGPSFVKTWPPSYARLVATSVQGKRGLPFKILGPNIQRWNKKLFSTNVWKWKQFSTAFLHYPGNWVLSIDLNFGFKITKKLFFRHILVTLIIEIINS